MRVLVGNTPACFCSRIGDTHATTTTDNTDRQTNWEGGREGGREGKTFALLNDEHGARRLCPAHAPQIDAHAILDGLVHAYECDFIPNHIPSAAWSRLDVVNVGFFL